LESGNIGVFDYVCYIFQGICRFVEKTNQGGSDRQILKARCAIALNA
jgi:hypothetical protein